MHGERLADQILYTEEGGAYRRFDEVGVGGFGTISFFATIADLGHEQGC
jgi:hypothetical protein